MEDDILTQLMNLAKDRPTTTKSSNPLGGSSIGSELVSNDLLRSGEEMFKPDDIVVPDIKPKKEKRERKQIVVIDDDFSTLDLMKIYLLRDYEYKAFDNPKNAIFHLNTSVPDLIFIDSDLNLVKTKRVIEIIRTYKELKKVPMIYLADPSEEASLKSKLTDGVLDIISRPVKRGDLQRILDTYLTDTDDSDTAEEVKIDHPII